MDHTPAPEASDTLRPGTALGRYEIRRLLGRGGMGCVYEAVHRDLKKRVAIKTLLPALAASADARTRFLREGEAASRIRHPHVVDVTDTGAEGTISFLVMEFLEGEDLAKLIARQGALSATQTADVMLPVAAAISAAHDQGVIHRDLKPENIFLSRSAMGGVHPKVLDFGISKVTSDRATMVLTGTGATFGTTFYLPPELLQGARQADAKSDQYALGTILYECVTGQRAFEGHNLYAVLKDIAEGRYQPPRLRRPDLPASMEALITRAMSLEPSERFETVKELGSALLGLASPNARVVWMATFGGSPGEDGRAHRVATGGSSISGGTMILPEDAAEFARASMTPPPPSSTPPALSTFRHATGESKLSRGSVPDLRRSRVPVFAVLAVLAAVGGGLAVMWPRDNSSHRTAITSLGQTFGRGSKEDPKDDPQQDPKDELRPARPPEPKTYRVEIETDPRSATIELDGRPVGRGVLDQRLPLDGSEHVIVSRAPGYREMIVRFTDRPPPHLLALDPVPAANPVAVEPAPTRAPVSAMDNQDRPAHRRRGSSNRPSRGVRGREASPGSSQPSGSSGSGLLPNGAPIID